MIPCYKAHVAISTAPENISEGREHECGTINVTGYGDLEKAKHVIENRCSGNCGAVFEMRLNPVIDMVVREIYVIVNICPGTESFS